DPGMEEALYEVASMRQFARLSLLEAMPDESTILRFRPLLEQNEIAPQILERVNAHLNRQGLLLKRGTMVDATIIEAPSLTKNASGGSAIRRCTKPRRATTGTSACRRTSARMPTRGWFTRW